jgi:hypothetical protein
MFCTFTLVFCRSQWPRCLRRWSAAERFIGSWVRIPPGAWMFVSCTVFLSSGRGLCDGPIPRPDESYPMWCVCLSVIKWKIKNPLHLLWTSRQKREGLRNISTSRSMCAVTTVALFCSALISCFAGLLLRYFLMIVRRFQLPLLLLV